MALRQPSELSHLPISGFGRFQRPRADVPQHTNLQAETSLTASSGASYCVNNVIVAHGEEKVQPAVHLFESFFLAWIQTTRRILVTFSAPALGSISASMTYVVMAVPFYEARATMSMVTKILRGGDAIVGFKIMIATKTGTSTVHSSTSA